MAYKGKYKPVHPEKYKGDPSKITYRSLWERDCMKTFDHGSNYLAWCSEEIPITYQSPIDGLTHKYYPDFAIKMKSKTGDIKKFLIEVKPEKQVAYPKLPKSGKKTRAYQNAVNTWEVNQAKWAAARRWCEKQGYTFQILTEKQTCY